MLDGNELILYVVDEEHFDPEQSRVQQHRAICALRYCGQNVQIRRTHEIFISQSYSSMQVSSQLSLQLEVYMYTFCKIESITRKSQNTFSDQTKSYRINSCHSISQSIELPRDDWSQIDRTLNSSNHLPRSSRFHFVSFPSHRDSNPAPRNLSQIFICDFYKTFS